MSAGIGGGIVVDGVARPHEHTAEVIDHLEALAYGCPGVTIGAPVESGHIAPWTEITVDAQIDLRPIETHAGKLTIAWRRY